MNAYWEVLRMQQQNPEAVPIGCTVEIPPEDATYKPLENLPDKELKKIAKDLWANRIFTSLHVQNPRDLGMVFMPFALKDGWSPDEAEDLVYNWGMMYEYYEKAGPRSVNGMPNFFSYRVITRHDTSKVLGFYNELKKLLGEFDGESDDSPPPC
jgi:hypothetical protein